MNRKRLVRLCVVMMAAALAVFAPAAALASFGIDPGKVYISNLHPGSEAEYTITLYNQGDEDATYQIAPRMPDYTDPEYESFPYLEWITVTPENVTIPGGNKADITVRVQMPVDADYYDKKGEAWISFTIAGDTAMVQIELASRLFISTRAFQPTATATESPTITESDGEGSVSISLDAQKTSTATQKPNSSSDSGYSWVPLGIVLGVIVIAGAVYLLVIKKKPKAS